MKKALFVVLCVCIGLSAMAQVTLTFNPEKGSKYEYQTEMIQKIDQSIMGQKMDMTQNMVFTYDMDILENSTSEVKVDFIFKEIVYNLSSAMMNMKYDSKSTNASSGMDGMMAKIFGSMINKKFQIVITPQDGAVKSVTGMEAILDDMTKAVGGNEMIAAQMGEQIKQQFNDEAVRNNFSTFFKIYPGKPVKPGDSWTVEQITGATVGMNMNIKNTYLLKSADKEKAIAELNSIVSGMDGHLSGEQTGIVEFDLKSGLPFSSKLTQQIKGTISTNGMEIPMDIQSNINVSVKKIK